MQNSLNPVPNHKNTFQFPTSNLVLLIHTFPTTSTPLFIYTGNIILDMSVNVRDREGYRMKFGVEDP
jgi:hypothetical protein